MEEPLVLSGRVALLQQLLDGLLGVLTVCGLLEGVAGHGALETLEFESVAGGEEMRVVDDLTSRQHPLAPLNTRKFLPTKFHLDERLDLASPCNLLLTHPPRHFSGVAFDAGNDGVGVWSLLGTVIELLDDNDLFAGLATLEADGDLIQQNSFSSLFQTPITRFFSPFRACRLQTSISASIDNSCGVERTFDHLEGRRRA